MSRGSLHPHADYLLAGAAMLLVMAAIWPWLAPANSSGLPAPASEPAAPRASIAALPTLDSLAAIFERPLFSPSRRPPAASGPAAPGPGPASRYRLLGLIAAGPTRRALLADGPRRFEVAEGAVLDGWVVTRIEQDRMVLTSPAGEATLRLPRAGDGKATPAASDRPTR